MSFVWFLIFIALTLVFGEIKLYGGAHLLFSFLAVVALIWIGLDILQKIFEGIFSGLFGDDDKK